MAERQNSIEFPSLTDQLTPVGEQLSGKYKRSFAYSTIKDRLPVILTRVIDSLSRDKEEIIQKYGQGASDDVKGVIGYISKLKNEIVTNKALLPLTHPSGATAEEIKDIKLWNDYLEERTEIEGQTPTWFETIWLYCECYMYRRLAEAFALTKTLKKFDPFCKQKQEGFNGSIDGIVSLARYTLSKVNNTHNLSSTELEQELTQFVKFGLWGNRCDLSLSGGAASGQVGDPVTLLHSLDKDILVNEVNLLWNTLDEYRVASEEITLDIMLDNAGYELFTDFCLAAFLVAHNLAHKIRFYVKQLPWYVSDVTRKDFDWTIQRLLESDTPELVTFGNLLKGYLDNGTWTVEEESYWTLPFDFSALTMYKALLYSKLSGARVIIFKGDLNYRKLVGDINWDYTTPFTTALRAFKPTVVVALRTIKADVCVGLAEGQGEKLREEDPNWMITGQYGLIQVSDKSNLIHLAICPCRPRPCRPRPYEQEQ